MEETQQTTQPQPPVATPVVVTPTPKTSFGIPQLIIGLVLGGLIVWAFMTYGEELNLKTGKTTDKTYTSNGFGFSAMYPETWKTQECTDNASTLVAFGDKEPLVICSSDAPPGAYIMVGTVVAPYWQGTVDDQANQLSGILDDVKTTDVTFDGVAGKRIDGKMKTIGEGEGQQILPAGTIISQVIFIRDDKMYRIIYQDLADTKNTQQLDDFLKGFKLL